MQIIKKELDIIIFESPASKRTIRYCDDYEAKMHSFYLSMPRMRFYSVGNHKALTRLYINFVGSDNFCYPALLPNVGFFGDVCLGDMRNIVFCEKIIYNSFLASDFSSNGMLLLGFLRFKFKSKIKTIKEFNSSIIKFLNLWQENGLDFQNLYFVDLLRDSMSYNLTDNIVIDSENELFKTYMSLAQ